MKKKIFVSRDTRSGFRTSLKFLFWAAIGLVVLVLFIPLTSRQKAGKEVAKKPPVEKGRVMKEIPRSLQPIAESLSRGQGEPAEVPREPEGKAVTAAEGKGPGNTTTPAPATVAKDKPAESQGTPPKAEHGVEGGPKGLASRPATTEPTAGPGLKEPQPTPTHTPAAPLAPAPSDEAAKAAQAGPGRKPEPVPPSAAEAKQKAVAAVSPPGKTTKPSSGDTPRPTSVPSAINGENQKPAAAGGQKLYAVQIATLKDKSNAEELKKTLQKKGFDVVLKTTGDPKHGQSFTVQLQPVDSMGKASTMLEQVKYVPQVKPSIVTVQPGN